MSTVSWRWFVFKQSFSLQKWWHLATAIPHIMAFTEMGALSAWTRAPFFSLKNKVLLWFWWSFITHFKSSDGWQGEKERVIWEFRRRGNAGKGELFWSISALLRHPCFFSGCSHGRCCQWPRYIRQLFRFVIIASALKQPGFFIFLLRLRLKLQRRRRWKWSEQRKPATKSKPVQQFLRAKQHCWSPCSG